MPSWGFWLAALVLLLAELADAQSNYICDSPYRVCARCCDADFNCRCDNICTDNPEYRVTLARRGGCSVPRRRMRTMSVYIAGGVGVGILLAACITSVKVFCRRRRAEQMAEVTVLCPQPDYGQHHMLPMATVVHVDPAPSIPGTVLGFVNSTTVPTQNPLSLCRLSWFRFCLD